jgi:hypothetical protein
MGRGSVAKCIAVLSDRILFSSIHLQHLAAGFNEPKLILLRGRWRRMFTVPNRRLHVSVTDASTTWLVIALVSFLGISK